MMKQDEIDRINESLRRVGENFQRACQIVLTSSQQAAEALRKFGDAARSMMPNIKGADND